VSAHGRAGQGQFFRMKRGRIKIAREKNNESAAGGHIRQAQCKGAALELRAERSEAS